VLRVALMRGDDYHNRYLDQLLRRRFDVVLTVIEPGKEQRKALRRRGKWKDAIAAEYHSARRSVLGLQRYRAHYFGSLPELSPAHNELLHVVRTNSINAPRVRSALADAGADVCVITCTSILTPTTIRAAGSPIINIHGGHLPDYRGCHCFFFALYEGRFDKVGSILHFVDVGIDTGDIIEVVRPAIYPSDNPEKLYSRAEKLAAHRLVYWLERMEIGEGLPRLPQPYRGRLCLRRDRLPHHDVLFAASRLTGRIRLPTVEQFQKWDGN
jgi:methionyl-tRNA formyltransferase